MYHVVYNISLNRKKWNYMCVWVRQENANFFSLHVEFVSVFVWGLTIADQVQVGTISEKDYNILMKKLKTCVKPKSHRILPYISVL